MLNQIANFQIWQTVFIRYFGIIFFMIRRDTLLAESVRSVIRDNLSEMALKKIENRLYEKHHMSIPVYVSEFPKLDDVLKEYFGAGAENLEKKIMTHMLALEKSKT